MCHIYLSKTANPLLIQYLRQQRHTIDLVDEKGFVYEEISTHPDIYMCKLGVAVDAPLFIGDKTELGKLYPEAIRFNAACTGKFFIHNFKYTSKPLLAMAEQMDMIMVHVKQGYAKCNMVIVDESSIITSDKGIAQACQKASMEVLFIRTGYVELAGFDYGFLGGASGRIAEEILFNGDLSRHPDFQKIIAFIKNRRLKAKWFPEYALTDIGSIICE